MRLATFTLEGKKLPRIIFSVLPSPTVSLQEVSLLMTKAYQMGITYFDRKTFFEDPDTAIHMLRQCQDHSRNA